LKHSRDWGYHAELEILVNGEEEKETAEAKIRKIAKELEMKLMSDQELSTFTKRIDQEYRGGSRK
jgi:hypothetical protein